MEHVSHRTGICNWGALELSFGIPCAGAAREADSRQVREACAVPAAALGHSEGQQRFGEEQQPPPHPGQPGGLLGLADQLGGHAEAELPGLPAAPGGRHPFSPP